MSNNTDNTNNTNNDTFNANNINNAQVEPTIITSENNRCIQKSLMKHM